MQNSPDNYQYLGKKTFRYWLWQKSVGAIIIFLTAIVLLVLANGILPDTIADITIPWTLIILAVFLLSFLLFAGAFISTRFMYAYNRFLLDDDALRIRRGMISQEEFAIPYRQIQTVDIERSYSQQIFGLSRVVILTAGQGFGRQGDGGESNEIFSAMDTEIASWLQAELLKRANVQKVTEAYPQEQNTEQPEDYAEVPQSPQGGATEDYSQQQ